MPPHTSGEKIGSLIMSQAYYLPYLLLIQKKIMKEKGMIVKKKAVYSKKSARKIGVLKIG